MNVKLHFVRGIIKTKEKETRKLSRERIMHMY